jgi:hypothetical protein
MVRNQADSKSQILVVIGQQKDQKTVVEVFGSYDSTHGKQMPATYFTEIDRQARWMKGFEISGESVNQHWQINLPSEGEIGDVRSMHQTKTSTEAEHYLPITFSGDKSDNLIYKFLDSNLLAVSVVCEQTSTLQIFVVNGITGKIIYKFQESSVATKEPIDMLLEENFFILTFKRQAKGSGLPIQQLSVTEFYESNEEKDTVQMLKDRYFNDAPRITKEQYSSVQMETPFAVQETYVLPVDVKKIGLTKSKSHVTGKLLVLLTQNDQVYSIEHVFWSARRERKEEAEAKEQKELEKAVSGVLPTPKYMLNDSIEIEPIDIKSKAYPPYDGVIPQKNKAFVSYDLQLLGLSEIYTFATRIESTSAVLVTGHDLFYARVTGESHFDKLQDSFRVHYVYMGIGGLLACLWFAKSYETNKTAKEKFLMTN